MYACTRTYITQHIYYKHKHHVYLLMEVMLIFRSWYGCYFAPSYNSFSNLGKFIFILSMLNQEKASGIASPSTSPSTSISLNPAVFPLLRLHFAAYVCFGLKGAIEIGAFVHFGLHYPSFADGYTRLDMRTRMNFVFSKSEKKSKRAVALYMRHNICSLYLRYTEIYYICIRRAL